MGGPGETQIEADRRQIDQRITHLKRALTTVRRTRGLHRQARRRVPYPVVALVGYTNAGKSTLFNTLTRSAVDARDQLFATLDPTMRGIALPSGRTAILSDTVGFVSALPHELVAAFHATLEEVCEADVVVHVRDAAHPDNAAQKDDVTRVLDEIGLDQGPDNGLVEVLNKVDLLADEEREILANRSRRANRSTVLASALSGAGCEALLAVLDEKLARAMDLVEVALAPEDGASQAWLYERGEVLERRDEPDAVHMKVRLRAADAARFDNRRRNGVAE
jgi:GTP-binding protein HflX